MPRTARRDSHPLAGKPGTSYHVTARGHDGCLIFHSDRDRLYFFACIAEACDHFGLLCHAAVLMPNHIHLVLEDIPGLLSQFMHRLLGHYALYFNRSRSPRRRGALFQDQFDAQVLDSEAYFRMACGYAFLNPLRCRSPLASSPEDYRWSTAAFALAPEQVSAAEYCQAWLERWGGLEAVLAMFPRPSRPSSRAMLVRRLTCLYSGAWLDRSRLLAARTPAQYREALQRQAKCARPVPENAEALDAHLAGTSPAPAEVPPVEPSVANGGLQAVSAPPKRRDPFTRLHPREALERIREVCVRVLPSEPAELEAGMEQMTAYLAWRFGEQDEETLAGMLSMAASLFAEARDVVRRLRAAASGWREVLWRAEWALRWRLLAAPIRD